MIDARQKKSSKLFCKVCVKSQRDNVFVKGKLATTPKIDDLSKHEKTEDHKLALSSQKEAESLQAAVNKAYSSMEETITALMKTVLCLGQADIPYSKLETIIELQLENVSGTD